MNVWVRQEIVVSGVSIHEVHDVVGRAALVGDLRIGGYLAQPACDIGDAEGRQPVREGGPWNIGNRARRYYLVLGWWEDLVPLRLAPVVGAGLGGIGLELKDVSCEVWVSGG